MVTVRSMRLGLAGALLLLGTGGAHARPCSERRVEAVQSRCEKVPAPRPTHAVTMAGNLHPDAFLLASGFVDDGTFESAFDTSNFSLSIAVHDQLGERRELLLFFTRTGPDAWSLNVGLDGGDLGETPGRFVRAADERALAFVGGRLRPRRPVVLRVPFGGPEPQRIAVDLAGLTQLPAPSGVSCVVADGCAGGP